MRLLTTLFLVLATVLSSTSLTARPDDDDRCEIRGFVGVTHDMPSNSKLMRMGISERGGAYLTTIVGCSAAQEAGLQPMDYLVSVDGKFSSRDEPFFCLLSDLRIGESAKVGFYRQGRFQETKLTLGDRRDACQDVRLFPKKGFFGISDGDTDRSPGLIVDVSSRGPVAALGMRDGDRILSINDYPINDWHDLSTVKRLLDDLDNVAFRIQRDGQDQLLTGPITESETGDHNWSWSDDSEKTYTIIADDCEDLIVDGDKIKIKVKEAINSIDLDEIEREVESALAEVDFAEIEQESRNAVEIAFEAVREAFAELREDEDFPGSSSNIDPADMEARLEDITSEDIDAMVQKSIDMPRRSNLDVRNFSASPNPSDGRFKLAFTLPKSGETSIQIYSSAGREIYAYDLGTFSGSFDDELDVMRNGPGAYFLVIRQDAQAFTKKLVFVRK